MTFAGHEEAWREWRDALTGTRMHHGWILAGRKGLGKAGFALAAARELVAEPGIPQPPGEHPDVIVLSHLPASADDEAKKAEIVVRLRAKLGEVADLMQAKQEQRLAQAEERLGGLKERIEYAKAHREEMLDEQVQRVLSGERPQRPEAFKRFPHAKGGMGGPDFGPGDDMPPPPEGADELAPLPENMPEGMPPPPAE